MDELFINKVEEKNKRPDIDITPGDTVKVSLKITEAGKARTQVFEGTVIAINGKNTSKSITVRKISYGVGVEKIFPLNSPIIKKIEVTEKGNVRRAKLYYMRGRIGKRSLDVNFDEAFDSSADSAQWEEGDGDKKVDDEPKVEEKVIAKKENIKEKEGPESKPAEKKSVKKTPSVSSTTAKKKSSEVASSKK